mgnify:CR=1 FL=1
MTTIAVRDGVVAADTACFHADRHVGAIRKVRRVPGGIVAICGEAQDAARAFEWFESGCPDERPAGLADSISGLFLREDQSVLSFDHKLIFMAIEADFHAYGSGSKVATGAMEMGATAAQAVAIACKYDAYTRHPIHAEALA